MEIMEKIGIIMIIVGFAFLIASTTMVYLSKNKEIEDEINKIRENG